MGDISEFSEKLQDFLRTYPKRKFDPVPWTPLKKPLSECKLALVSSAGFIAPGQETFNHDIKGGDVSWREIPYDVDITTLIDDHHSKSYSHYGLHQDLNVGFPITRMRELAENGRIGSVNHRHLSFNGAISATGRLATQFAPKAAKLMVEDGVDIALLVPV
jgi:D-proline reductase (dithiol) PrdB